jgi:hypothetical protein
MLEEQNQKNRPTRRRTTKRKGGPSGGEYEEPEYEEYGVRRFANTSETTTNRKSPYRGKQGNDSRKNSGKI